MVGSMGRAGAPGDNAAMESFFSPLQKNVLDRPRWDTREGTLPEVVGNGWSGPPAVGWRRCSGV